MAAEEQDVASSSGGAQTSDPGALLREWIRQHLPASDRIRLFSLNTFATLSLGFFLYNNLGVFVLVAIFSSPSRFIGNYTNILPLICILTVFQLIGFIYFALTIMKLVNYTYALIWIILLSATSVYALSRPNDPGNSLMFAGVCLSGLMLSLPFLLMYRAWASKAATRFPNRVATSEFQISDEQISQWGELFRALGPNRARQIIEFEKRAEQLLRKSNFVLSTIIGVLVFAALFIVFAGYITESQTKRCYRGYATRKAGIAR